MRGLLKSLGILFPPLRRLHEERNLYAQDVANLHVRLLSTETTSKCIENENVTLQSTNAKLRVEVERLSKLPPVVASHRLHIIGYARSGTTIMMDILNSSSEVFLFSELNLHVLRKFPELFSSYGGDGFVEHFAERKRKELPLTYKGAVPPSSDLDYLTPDQYVDAVGQSFRYVGDKIATSHRYMGGVLDLELLKDFLEQEDKSGAVLIFMLRRPSENLLSISKMFPEADLKLWGKSIAETSIAIMEYFLKGNQSYLVFHEDINPSLVVELSELLGMKFTLSPELVGTAHQTTKNAQFSIDDPWVGELDSAYYELYKIYRCDKNTIKHSKTDGLIKKISSVLIKIKDIIAQIPINQNSEKKKITLGISRTHDVSAALFKGCELLGIAEAERVMEIKHARGPEMLVPAIIELLIQHNIAVHEIDAIAIADTGREQLEAKFPGTLDTIHGDNPLAKLGQLSVLKDLPLGDIALGFRDDVDVFYSCHHASHAMSALYQAGFEECAILVVDGYGICCGTMAYHYKNGQLRRLDDFKDAALLGWRYQLFGHFPKEIVSEKTDILDLAGKVMGLNAYGKPVPEYVAYFVNWFRGDFSSYVSCWNLDQTFFEDLISDGLRKDGASVEDPIFLNVVSSMQEAYSQVMAELASRLLQETGLKNLIVTGGCALNVLANTRLSTLAENVFFQPNSGDSGLALGSASAAAAFLASTQLHHPEIATKVRRNPYIGLGLADAELLEGLIPTNLQKHWLPEGDRATCTELTKSLAAGEIVGMVRGRSEIGPRALGNRSILAHAARPDMRDILNSKIKHREWWRPFAPVCRAIDAEEYFSFAVPSPYMLTAATVRPAYLEKLKSACHEDGTARLQVLPDRDWHPLLWDILGELKAQTGIGVLINTSFNDGGKPLLNRALSAIEMLENTQMDIAWIDGWLFSKSSKKNEQEQ
jgi:carbamoyltransferase